MKAVNSLENKSLNEIVEMLNGRLKDKKNQRKLDYNVIIPYHETFKNGKTRYFKSQELIQDTDKLSAKKKAYNVLREVLMDARARKDILSFGINYDDASVSRVYKR